MDALEILLDSAERGLAQLAAVPGRTGFYVLEADGELVVNLHEDPGSHSISFFAGVGYLDGADWLIGRQDVWSCAARDNPDDPDATRVLHVEPASGLIIAVHAIPRAHLHSVRFREELERFVSVCRSWKSLLPIHPLSPS
jgi:hypothetical protein